MAARKDKELECDALYLYILLYCCIEEHQPHIKRTVLFDNESSSLSCRNLGSSGPKLHRLVIPSFLGLHTDSGGGIRLGEMINIYAFTGKFMRFELFF
jgi:hypothetical protein